MLDDWQCLVLREACRLRPDGKWAARTVDLLVGRQNGKGSVLEARQLAGLVLFGERTAVHSAHETKTCDEHFLRMQELIQHPLIAQRVRTVRTANGQQAIVMRTKERLKFVARSEASGRGFTGDVMYLDEAYAVTDPMIRALYSTMAARSKLGNPQAWLTSSAPYGDRPQHAWWHTRVGLMRSKHRPPNALYLDWGTPPPTREEIAAAGTLERAIEVLIQERDRWWNSNPGLGVRIAEDFCEDELGMLGPMGFAVERLGLVIPPEDAANRSGIELSAWDALAGEFELGRGARLGLAVDEHGARGCIVAAAMSNGRACVEIVASGGIGELVDAIQRQPAGLIGRLDFAGNSHASIVVAQLGKTSFTCQKRSNAEVADAEAGLVHSVASSAVAHRADPVLRGAILAAEQVQSGDRWSWSLKRASGDVTPLKAAALAVAACSRGPVRTFAAY